LNPLTPAETLRFAEILGVLFSEQSAPIPEDAEALALKGHFGPLLYWFAIQRQSPASEELERSFTSAAALQMVHENALKKLYRRMEQARIPFVPLKGTDLAFRIYPVPALRLFNDWDIWIRRADRKRFLTLLKEEGWTCPLNCFSEHHWGGWQKERFLLEPHFALPNFPGVPVRKLWETAEPSAAPGMQLQLSGSMNLILLFQHNALEHFQQNLLLKLLIDTEFLLRSGSVDWRQVSMFAREWQLPHPGLLLAAFPEFFRDRWNFGSTFPKETISALRTQLLEPCDMVSEQERLNAIEARLTDLAWLRARLQHLRRDILQLRYPQMGPGTFAYLRCLCRDISRKFHAVALRHLSPEEKSILLRKRAIGDSWRYGADASPAQDRYPKT